MNRLFQIHCTPVSKYSHPPSTPTVLFLRKDSRISIFLQVCLRVGLSLAFSLHLCDKTKQKQKILDHFLIKHFTFLQCRKREVPSESLYRGSLSLSNKLFIVCDFHFLPQFRALRKKVSIQHFSTHNSRKRGMQYNKDN